MWGIDKQFRKKREVKELQKQAQACRYVHLRRNRVQQGKENSLPYGKGNPVYSYNQWKIRLETKWKEKSKQRKVTKILKMQRIKIQILPKSESYLGK